MVVGNGLLANKFNNDFYNNYVVFASGVSNSTTIDTSLFEREKSLLIETLSDINLPILYFSTISLLTMKNPYFEHKKNMERIIQNSGKDYYIFRLPQVIGDIGNPNNIINFFKNKISNNQKFDIWGNSERSIIDVDDVLLISTNIINNFDINKIYNVAGIEFKSIREIIEILENILSKKSNYSIIENISEITKENSNEVNISISKLSLGTSDYTKNILEKYVKNI